MYTKDSNKLFYGAKSVATIGLERVNLVSLTYLSTVLVDNYPQALLHIASG